MARRRTRNRKEDANDKTSKSTPVSSDREVSKERTPGVEADREEKKTNDPQWYDQIPELTRDAANLPWNLPFGANLRVYTGTTPTTPGVSEPYALLDAGSYLYNIAGICSLKLKPSFGDSTTMNSPLNVAANALYTHVRYVNSGRKNYDPSDLMLYCLTFGEIYSYLVWCMRLYNYAYMYSERNYYIAKQLIEANGVNPDSIVQNLANFRYWINSCIAKVSAFAVPASIYFFKRRVFLYANFYIENPYGNIKDQLYQLVPFGFHQFRLDADGAGSLKFCPWAQQTNKTISDIQSMFTTLFASIQGDEDFGIMSGDILKAFGSDIIGLSPLGTEGGIMPVYDPMVLSQFKNAKIFNVSMNTQQNGAADSDTYTVGTKTGHYGDLQQTTQGILISREGWSSSSMKEAGLCFRPLISVENPNPTTDDVMEATRLMVAGQTGRRLYTGTEIVISTEIITSRVTGLDNIGNPDFISNALGQSIVDLTRFGAALQFAQFKYAPILYMIHSNDYTTTAGDEFAIVGNLDSTVVTRFEEIQRLHEVAILSMFYVPGVAKMMN